MKVKGLEGKIYRLSSNSINFNVGLLDKLKEGKSVELAKEDAEQLIGMGVVSTIKESKVKEKNNG